MTKAPYRLLILTASTGGGHDARADAMVAWARELYGESAEVKIFRPLEQKEEWLGQLGVEAYNVIQRRAPRLHDVYFPIIEMVGDWQGENYIGKAAYETLLRDFKPQLVVSLHDFLNRGFFGAAKRILGEGVKTVTYCGEFSDGAGFSKHWVCPTHTDCWVGRTAGAVAAAKRLGLPYEKLSAFSFFLSPEDVEASQMNTPRAEIRKNLGLEAGKLTIFLASGRNGAVTHMKYLKALLPYKDSVQIIVVCGLNERLRQAVAAWVEQNKFPARVEGFSSRMHEYLRAADIVIFKGGANTATKAFWEGCPMGFDASQGILPQEKLTVDYFVGAGAGVVIDSPAALARRVASYLRAPSVLPTMRTAMEVLRQTALKPLPRAFFKELLAWGFAATPQVWVDKVQVDNLSALDATGVAK